MNNLIKELRQECIVRDTDGTYLDFDIDKYTKLIVQQCISIIALLGVSQYENEDISWAADLAVKQIKEKMGME